MNIISDSYNVFFILACIATGVGYCSYWLIGNGVGFIRVFTMDGTGSIMGVVARRILGFVLMGVIPLVTVVVFAGADLGDVGLQYRGTPRIVYWLLGMGVMAVLVNWLAAIYSEHNNRVYPQIRQENWTIKTFIIDFGTWAIYLLGYEFLFRGLFLFASLQVMDNTSAIALNVMVYAMAHLPKGAGETVGSALLGTLMCFAVIRSGSMWVAFFIHVLMAWSSTILSFVYNPRFKYVGWRG